MLAGHGMAGELKRIVFYTFVGAISVPLNLIMGGYIIWMHFGGSW